MDGWVGGGCWMNKYVDGWTVMCMYSMNDGWIDIWLSKWMDG